MPYYYPHEVIGFHSCDKQLGIAVLNGKENLIPSNNTWDWLGDGIYFWEQNPFRALQYAEQSAAGTQYNKKRIKTPFVLGAIIELGNCLNLVELESVQILSDAHKKIKALYRAAETPMPKNDNAKRNLDCAVIKAIHESNKEQGKRQYDSVRSAFDEGQKAYFGANFTSQSHIQVCLRNTTLIRGYFLPRPIEVFNPYLTQEFEKIIQPKLF